MAVAKETKDEAANFIFAKRIQTGLELKYFEPYQHGDPFMTSEQHEHSFARLQRQQQLLDYIYALILNDIKNDNESN